MNNKSQENNSKKSPADNNDGAKGINFGDLVTKFQGADEFYSVNIKELNNSGVSAQAILAVEDYGTDDRRWFGEAPAGVTLATLEATAARMDRPGGVRLECNDARVCADGKIAYARLRSGRLGVCPRFFETGSGGLDSRFGILIHEMTHIAARTGDHAYRPSGAARIADTDPTLAARNADNYQYFVETLPMLRTAGKDEHVGRSGFPEAVVKPVGLRLNAGDATAGRVRR